MTKYVYAIQEGSAKMNDLLGGKGAHLSEMAAMNLPVPPAFVITTEACREYLLTGHLSDHLWNQILEHLNALEQDSKCSFENLEHPLIVSVRSSGPISMPGMMDTILNLGLNPTIAQVMYQQELSIDLTSRFLEMFIHSVHGLKQGVHIQSGMTVLQLWEETERKIGLHIPRTPIDQLKMAIEAVFRSWGSRRARTYRKHRNIPEDLGTAVVVQKMVFGNRDQHSGTGVFFSRNPLSGERELYGDYLIGAQGEDIVSGQSTPAPLSSLALTDLSLYENLKNISNRLEKHYRDIQDIEFTVESGNLYILQTRTAKRTAEAAVKIAVDMVQEGIISPNEALLRVTPNQVLQLYAPKFDGDKKEKAITDARLLGIGTPACPGSATGVIVFDSERGVTLSEEGKNVILVRPETSPHDIDGMLSAVGLLTTQGGSASHAAVVARELDKPCVVGFQEGVFSDDLKSITIGEQVFYEGDTISVDGTTGEVIRGELPFAISHQIQQLEQLLSWADEQIKGNLYAITATDEQVRISKNSGVERFIIPLQSHHDHSQHLKEAIKPVQRIAYEEEIWKTLENGPTWISVDTPRLLLTLQEAVLNENCSGLVYDLHRLKFLLDGCAEDDFIPYETLDEEGLVPLLSESFKRIRSLHPDLPIILYGESVLSQKGYELANQYHLSIAAPPNRIQEIRLEWAHINLANQEQPV
ncbi:pyruvate, phosphate dikinase [Bacillus sp. MRMR6]|uniref:pyruvate, phosphate dikinase n=1 Tax=Bacillus sp. MRMR6 TaxID=1928617 RepID=UPI00095116BD|nr:pyruvate, phosphate dikinase [Bacillus sp. MRMR6]OLS40724.1 hypothetical protein BTR25_07455 [Bacillus sp. MRMR6]